MAGEAKSRVVERIMASADRIFDLTRRLVAIPTENPPGTHYRDCVELVASELRALDLSPQVIEVPGNRKYPRYVLLCGVGSGPTLYLHGHYDVVPANRPEQFEPVVKGDRIIGRGTADMKGGIAAMVHALGVLRHEELDGRVELVFVPDEETGGKHGSEYLFQSGQLGRDGLGAIVGEPTGGVIWNGSRGAVTLRVRVTGRPAHVGLHYEGRNAFEGALPILAALQRLKARVALQRTSFAIEPEAAKESILMLGGEVEGGHQFNVVPDHLSFTVERRFNPEEELEVEKKRLLDTIEEGRPEDMLVEVEVIQEAASSGTDAANVFARAVADSVEEVTGRRPAFELCPGLLESRFYAWQGMPALAYGPGDLAVSHGPDEFVETRRLVACSQVYALTALTVLQSTMR